MQDSGYAKKDRYSAEMVGRASGTSREDDTRRLQGETSSRRHKLQENAFMLRSNLHRLHKVSRVRIWMQKVLGQTTERGDEMIDDLISKEKVLKIITDMIQYNDNGEQEICCSADDLYVPISELPNEKESEITK